MYKNKFVKAIVFILLVAGVLQAGIMAYSAVANQIIQKYTKEALTAGAQTATAAENSVPEEETSKKEIDISRVSLKKEVEAAIMSLDTANAAKNIKNYKTLLVALNVPQSFQTEIETMYGKGHKVQDVLVAYEYLYYNYGNINELEGLISDKTSGKTWKAIFKEYKKNAPEFVPSNFEAGKLEQILQNAHLTPDDVVIADRTAHQSGMKFDELIIMREQGKDWKSINELFGIVNTSGELPRAAITSAQVKNYVKSTGLKEDKVIEALALANKLDKDGKAIVDKVKAGNTEEDIMAESLEAKYK